MDTFKDWPHKSPVAVEALVRAGLFYTGEPALFFFIFRFKCMSDCLCVRVPHACVVPSEADRGLGPVELESQMAVSYILWPLEPKPTPLQEQQDAEHLQHRPHSLILVLCFPLCFDICHRSLWKPIDLQFPVAQPLNLWPLHCFI